MTESEAKVVMESSKETEEQPDQAAAIMKGLQELDDLELAWQLADADGFLVRQMAEDRDGEDNANRVAEEGEEAEEEEHGFYPEDEGNDDDTVVEILDTNSISQEVQLKSAPSEDRNVNNLSGQSITVNHADAYGEDLEDLSVIQSIQHLEDERMARQLQFAHQLADEESQFDKFELPDQEGKMRSAAAARGASERNCMFCCCKTLSVIAGLAAIGWLIWYFMGEPNPVRIKNRLSRWGVLGNLTDWSGGFSNDPFLSDNSTTNWDNGGTCQGLSLTIYNALDAKWYPYFIKAVTQWDNGNPDALTLTTQNVSVDHSCSRVDGILKVCNNNFGRTGWLGINEIITSGGSVIQSSVAKMNEYYLTNADQYQKQYTMCHEMGHGFGLPHTDENFYNKDLGNCLDYTIHPEVNMQPATMNFERLKTLYGVVGSNETSNMCAAGRAGGSSFSNGNGNGNFYGNSNNNNGNYNSNGNFNSNGGGGGTSNGNGGGTSYNYGGGGGNTNANGGGGGGGGPGGNGNGGPGGHGNNNGGRFLNGNKFSFNGGLKRLTEEEEAEYQAAIEELEYGIVPNAGITFGSKWQLLEMHPLGLGSRYTRRLGQDYVLHVAVLHPMPDNI